MKETGACLHRTANALFCGAEHTLGLNSTFMTKCNQYFHYVQANGILRHFMVTTQQIMHLKQNGLMEFV